MYRTYFPAFLFIILFSCGEVSTREELKEKTDKDDIEIISEVYRPEIFDSTELTKLVLDSLRLKRNEIFARRGLVFKSKDLQKYFNKFRWYLPKYNNVDSQLNETEITNVNLIRYIENFKNERLNYLRNLPNMHNKKNMYHFLEVDFKDYPYWNEPIPEQSDPHTAIFVNGKKEFSNCIFISYYTYYIYKDGIVPPAIEYTYCIDVYDFNGLLVHSNSFNGDPLANYIIIENKIYYYINTYKSIYSEAEQDSGYYDELHMEVSGSKERAFYLNSFNKTVEEVN